MRKRRHWFRHLTHPPPQTVSDPSLKQDCSLQSSAKVQKASRVSTGWSEFFWLCHRFSLPTSQDCGRPGTRRKQATLEPLLSEGQHLDRHLWVHWQLLVHPLLLQRASGGLHNALLDPGPHPKPLAGRTKHSGKPSCSHIFWPITRKSVFWFKMKIIL